MLALLNLMLGNTLIYRKCVNYIEVVIAGYCVTVIFRLYGVLIGLVVELMSSCQLPWLMTGNCVFMWGYLSFMCGYLALCWITLALSGNTLALCGNTLALDVAITWIYLGIP